MRSFPDFKWTTKPPVGYQLDRSHPLAQGLAFAPLFNEGTGNTATDLSGQTAVGTFAGTGTAWSAGLKFNGSGYVDFGNPGWANNALAISVAAWVVPGATSRGDILSQWGTTGNRRFDLLAGLTASKFQFYVQQSNGTLTTTGAGATTYVVGQRYFVVGTYDGSVMCLYVNGILDASAAAAATGSVLGVPNSGIQVGSSASINNFTGSVDHPNILTRCLSAAEVGSLYADPYQMVLAPSLRRYFASSSTPQTVSPTLIASAESFGSHTVTPGAVSISPTLIASGEAFGSHTVTPGAVSISPTLIASLESFGSHVVSQASPQTISPGLIASGESFGTPLVTVQAVGLSVLGSAFIVDPASDLATVATPTAGQWITLDAAWGQTGVAAQVVTTSLAAPGASIDTAYSARVNGHAAGAAGRIGVEMGWSPDNTPVYLSTREAALGYWRLLFPTAGSYTLTLAGSSIPVTVIPAVVPDPDPIIPATPTTPQMTRVAINPLNRQASDIWRLQWNAPYPSGGFDLLPAQLGLVGPYFGDVNDTSLYRFAYDPKYYKLHVYASSGEVATGATLAFDTLGLFIGVSG